MTPVITYIGGNETLLSVALDTNFVATSDTTAVQSIAAAAMTLPTGTISHLRFTFVVQVGGDSWSLAGVYIGHAAGAGDAYDFAAAPVSVTFSGSSTYSIAAGESVVSDWTALAYDKTSALLLSLYFAGAETPLIATGITNVDYYSKGSVNEPATVDKTGYSTVAGRCLIRKIEALTA